MCRSCSFSAASAFPACSSLSRCDAFRECAICQNDHLDLVDVVRYRADGTNGNAQVLLNHNSPTFTSVYGFQVPTKYAAWLELVVIHFLVPHSSFLGHMCGILAGRNKARS